MILISPHNDDETLFAAYICLRFKPLIVVVTDAAIHEARYGKERGIEVRREESRNAARILGCDISFLGIPDTQDVGQISIKGIAITPAFQGGNKHHDQLSKYGQIHYATYTKDNLTPYLAGGVEIRPTPEEIAIKQQALACYRSQHDINAPHFEAVNKGQSEWLSRLP